MSRQKLPASMDTTAALVFAETAFFTGAGMEQAMHPRKAGVDYFLTDGARHYWLDKHALSIPKALNLSGADWDVDRGVVLPQAYKLGQLAAQFALADAGNATTVEVNEHHVEKASTKVNQSAECRAPKMHSGEKPKGAYCE